MSLLHQGPGVFFLLCAFILLVLVCCSVPVTHWLYFLQASDGSTDIRFGNWGYCIQTDGSGDFICTSRHLGYNATAAVDLLTTTGDISSAVIHGLTFALVLHPIAAGITAFAIFVSLTTYVILDICGSLISFLAFLVCVAALICDSILFITARNRINSATSGSSASLSNAYWMVVAATILLFIAGFTVCFGSRTARKQKWASESYAAVPTQTMAQRTHWWQRNSA